MTRNDFEKKWFLLKITWSDVVDGVKEENFSLEQEYIEKITDKHCYENQCHLLFNQYLFGYLDKTAPQEYTKLSDFKKLKQQISAFEKQNRDILWMNENDPDWPLWRLYLEETK